MALAAPASNFLHYFRDPFNALVVPAFHLNNPKSGPLLPTQLPRDVPALRTCMKIGQCEIFHVRNAFQAHSTTNTTYVLAHQDAPSFYQIPCFKSNDYEPYVVLRKGGPNPKYAEVFTGYGRNKIQHVLHLRMRGFRFHVLPQAFLVHYRGFTTFADRGHDSDGWI
jgi:hypothetical protein